MIAPMKEHDKTSHGRIVLVIVAGFILAFAGGLFAKIICWLIDCI